jgi:hypothetical protein
MTVRKKYGKSKRSRAPAPPKMNNLGASLPSLKDIRFTAQPAARRTKTLLAPGRVPAKTKTLAPLSRGPRQVLKSPTRLRALLSRITKDPRRQTLLASTIRSNVRAYDRLRAIRVRTLTSGRGAPKRDEIQFLVSMLLTAFYDYSGGKSVTRHYKKDAKPSAAGRFIQAIFDDLGISDADSWVRKHQSEKSSLARNNFQKTI